MLRRTRTFPGPRNLPLVGNPFALREPIGGLTRLHARYGDLAEFWVGSRHVVYVGDPDLAESILVRHRDATIKDTITRELSEVLGDGLVTSDGEHWRKQRKAIAPSFQPRHLAGYADAMVRSALECLPSPGPVDVHEAMTRTTLHIVLRTIFGAEPSGEAGEVGHLVEDLMEAFHREQRTFWRFVPRVVPARHRRAVVAARTRLDALIQRLIDQARSEPDGDALIHRLLAADADGTRMPDDALRDELLTLFLAGHETTSLLLSFGLWLLAEHPELQARAREEVDTVLAGTPPALEDLQRLPFCDAVLDETLRLYPPVWAIAREVVGPLELRGSTVPLGSQIVISMWMLHRDPRFWVGPDRFRPDRWLTGETADIPRLAFMPFGAGARICVGNHFAKMEALIALAIVLQHRTFTPEPGYAPDLIAAVTMRPRNGVRLRVAARPQDG